MVCVGGCSFVRCMVYALGYKVLFLIFGLDAGSNAPLRKLSGLGLSWRAWVNGK